MNTLISLKNSYHDFKQSYEIQLQRAKGQLKDSMNYGECYHIPIQKNKILFYFSNLDWHVERQLKLLKVICQEKLENDYDLIIVVGSKFSVDSIPAQLERFIHKESTKEAKKEFATARYIIAGESLPKYFVKKEEQVVIRFLGEIEEIPSRIELAQHKISWLLNSSLIVLENEEDKRILNEAYYLSGAYQGDFLVISSTEQDAEKKILKYILDQNIPEAKKGKQKKNILLILSTWKQEYDEEKYLNLITNAVNYDKYDITLVMKRPEDPNTEELLFDIPKKVRVIYRKGTFSCTPDEYTDIQYLLKNFDSFEDIEKAYGLLNKEILQRECRRLFGNMHFTEVIYIGKHSAVWTSLAAAVEGAYKIQIEKDDFTAELAKCDTITKKRAYKNKIKMHDMVFHQIVFISQTGKKDAVNNGFFDVNKAREFSFPSIIVHDGQETLQECVEYDSKKYFIGRQHEYLHGGMHLDLFPMPHKDQKAYISNGKINNIESIVHMFSLIAEQEKKSMLVVYGCNGDDLRAIGKRFGLYSELEAIEDEIFESLTNMSKYLSYFDGYLMEDNVWKYCPIRTSMELQKKKIIYYKGKELEVMKEKKFNNLQEYNTYFQNCWNNFLSNSCNESH